jgi:hypothetical protein
MPGQSTIVGGQAPVPVGPAPLSSPPAQDRLVSPQELFDAQRALEQMRSEHLKNMPLDQKLDMVLRQSTSAERVAYQALRGVEGFGKQLDKVFQDLSGMIERVAAGQPPREPDPSGSSIWGDDDESIM